MNMEIRIQEKERKEQIKDKENAVDWFTNNGLHFGGHGNTGTDER